MGRIVFAALVSITAIGPPGTSCAAVPGSGSGELPVQETSTRERRIVVASNVQVSRSKSDLPHTEVILAADPEDPDRLLAGSMLQYEPDRGFSGLRCIAYLSEDGGKTWRVSLEPAHGEPPLDTLLSDPEVAFGLDGAAYFGHMVRRKLPSGEGGTMMLHRSEDGGRSWEASPFVDAETRIDRPFLAFDRTDGPHRGRLYYQCTVRPEALGGTGGTQYALGLAYSADGGASFSPLTPRRVRYAGMDASMNVSRPAILSDGTVLLPYFLQMPSFGPYADLYNQDPAYRDGRVARLSINFERTRDGGESIAELPVARPGEPQPASASGVIAPWFRPPNTADTGFPWVVVDPGPGRFKDRLYAVWDEGRDGATRIMLSTSSDEGATWAEPARVDDLPAAADGGGRVYMPNVAVNSDGVVGVSWYDTRHVGAKRGWDVHFTASTDGGATWLPSVRVSEASTLIDEQVHERTARGGAPEGVGLFGVGDTTGLAADSRGAFHLLWIDNRTGMRQAWTARATITEAER